MAPSFPSNIFTCWNWKIQKERHRKNRIWAVGSLERRTRAWNSLEDYDPACWVQNIFSNLELLKGTHTGFFLFFFIKVQAITKKINKSIQTRRCAKNAKVTFPFSACGSLLIFPGWAHSQFSLRQTLPCAYSTAALEGLGRGGKKPARSKRPRKAAFSKTAFSPMCARTSLCSPGHLQLPWVLFLAWIPSSLRWCHGFAVAGCSLRDVAQQPRAQTRCPLSAVPSQSCQKPDECSCPVLWLQGM